MIDKIKNEKRLCGEAEFIIEMALKINEIIDVVNENEELVRLTLEGMKTVVDFVEELK